MASPAAEPWTVLRLLNWTKDHFAQAGIPEARLTAEMLLAHALSCRRIDLYARFDYQPTPTQLDVFRDLVKRARAHEPPAYLVGLKEFYSLPMKVTPDVLIPRPETELLADQAIAHLRKLARPGRMWDACTGSGCVAIAAAANVKHAMVLASDISPQAVAVAGENAAANKVADRVRCRPADLLSLPEDCRDLAPFDAITANPPYIAENDPVGESVKHEPALALRGGKDGLDFIRKLIPQVPEHLAAGGVFAMEFGYQQSEAVWDLIRGEKQLIEPKLLQDHQGIPRVIVAKKA